MHKPESLEAWSWNLIWDTLAYHAFLLSCVFFQNITCCLIGTILVKVWIPGIDHIIQYSQKLCVKQFRKGSSGKLEFCWHSDLAKQRLIAALQYPGADWVLKPAVAKILKRPFCPFLSSFFFVSNRPWAAQNQVAHVVIAKTPQRPVCIWQYQVCCSAIINGNSRNKKKIEENTIFYDSKPFSLDQGYQSNRVACQSQFLIAFYRKIFMLLLVSINIEFLALLVMAGHVSVTLW